MGNKYELKPQHAGNIIFSGRSKKILSFHLFFYTANFVPTYLQISHLKLKQFLIHVSNNFSKSAKIPIPLFCCQLSVQDNFGFKKVTPCFLVSNKSRLERRQYSLT